MNCNLRDNIHEYFNEFFNNMCKYAGIYAIMHIYLLIDLEATPLTHIFAIKRVYC